MVEAAFAATVAAATTVATTVGVEAQGDRRRALWALLVLHLGEAVLEPVDPVLHGLAPQLGGVVLGLQLAHPDVAQPRRLQRMDDDRPKTVELRADPIEVSAMLPRRRADALQLGVDLTQMGDDEMLQLA